MSYLPIILRMAMIVLRTESLSKSITCPRPIFEAVSPYINGTYFYDRSLRTCDESRALYRLVADAESADGYTSLHVVISDPSGDSVFIEQDLIDGNVGIGLTAEFLEHRIDKKRSGRIIIWT